MLKPCVSIVTPTFNAAPFIEACVESVLRQGDVVLEHIIVDGGSTDGTVETVMRLMRAHPRLRLIPGPDKGQSDAMNKGSTEARGEIIGLLNCDDFHQPGVIRSAAELLERTEEPSFVTGDCQVIDEHDKTVFWNRPDDLRVEALVLGWNHAQHPCNPSAYFYHKEVHHLAGGFDVDDHLTMDLDFLLSCAAKVPMTYVAEHWGNFRLMPGCKSFDNQDTAAERSKVVLERHKRRLNDRQRGVMNRLQAVRKLRDLKWALGRAVGRGGAPI